LIGVIDEHQLGIREVAAHNASELLVRTSAAGDEIRFVLTEPSVEFQHVVASPLVLGPLQPELDDPPIALCRREAFHRQAISVGRITSVVSSASDLSDRGPL
jgi:hypothetical protein